MDSLSLAAVSRLMLALERIYSISRVESFGPEVFAAVNQDLIRFRSRKGIWCPFLGYFRCC
jgi:hypothetical protein